MWKKFALVVVGVFLLFSGVFFYLVRDTDKIYNNISVSGIDLSNSSKETAKKKIDEIKLENVKLKYEGKEFMISGDSISYKVDSDKAVNEAYAVGRNGSFLKNKVKIFALKALGKKVVLPLHYTINEEALKEELVKIASEVDIKEQDARISIENDQISVIGEVNGKKINIEKTLDTVKESIKYAKHDDINLILETAVPKVTKEKLSSVNTLLGEYTTTFNAGVYGRSENIRLATSSINDVLLEPQETLSFNDSTGMRNPKNGYKSAPVIVNGEIEQGLGGGVCQVSSTLFNAGALSGLKIVERSNHSIPSSYVALGRDAVVDYGNLDLKIQNNFQSPVYIVSGVSGNKIIIKVYGNKSDKADEVKLFAVVNGSIPRKTKTVKSGKATNGRDGIRATTYRVIVKNGNETKEVLSSNYYPPKARVVVVNPVANPVAAPTASSTENTSSSL
jgi:vancomycin resistance protein YoaR